MAGRNLRRGFWRLVLLFWAAGALALIWWEDEPLLSPMEDVCAVEVEPPYDECVSEEAKRLARSETLTERLLGRARQTLEGIDPSKTVPRHRTQRYRSAARALLIWELWWAALIWAPFYLLVWALSGFRSPD